MCGIVGYTGPRQAGPLIIEGLKRLEYRGYDSAGMVTGAGRSLHPRKKSGRIAELARAAVEGVAFQVVDLVEAAVQDSPGGIRDIRADGGMARNDLFMQLQADLLGLPLLRSPHTEATALGAALLAGLKAGIWPDLDALRRLPRAEQRFDPRLAKPERQARVQGWRRAVATTVRHYTS